MPEGKKEEGDERKEERERGKEGGRQGGREGRKYYYKYLHLEFLGFWGTTSEIKSTEKQFISKELDLSNHGSQCFLYKAFKCHGEVLDFMFHAHLINIKKMAEYKKCLASAFLQLVDSQACGFSKEQLKLMWLLGFNYTK